MGTGYYGSNPQLDWGVQVVEPLKNLLAQVIGFIPLLVQALGIVLIGWAVAMLLRVLVKKFLEAINFDQLAEHMGITELLNEKKVGMGPSIWISKIIYWFGILVSWIIALDTLRLRIPSVMFEEIGHMLSRIFIGFFIFVIGLFLSVIVSKFVETTARRLSIAKPGLHAVIIRWAMILFTFMVTLANVGFPTDFLFVIMSAVGITLCISFVIAFGIGGIQWAPKILEKVLK